MNVLDLFTGIGGFSLGLEDAGMETVAFCEIEDYPRKVLAKHWPDVPIARDINELNYKDGILYDGSKAIYMGAIDVVCGGFPCQPFSVAGRKRGTEDDRDLWPQMFRIIQECKPTWIIGENVAGFVDMAFERTALDLESQGYEVQPLIIPACGVGAPHRRDRIWILAHSTSGRWHGRNGQQRISATEIGHWNAYELEIASRCGGNGFIADYEGRFDGEYYPQSKERQKQQLGKGVSGDDVSDTNYERAAVPSSRGLASQQMFRGTGKKRAVAYADSFHAQGQLSRSGQGEPWRSGWGEIEPTICGNDDGVPDRTHRLKALGNAVVPYIPKILGEAIMESENE